MKIHDYHYYMEKPKNLEYAAVKNSVLNAISILALYVFATMTLSFLLRVGTGDLTEGQLHMLWIRYKGILRIAFAIPCIIMLGRVISQNGFKFCFSLEGFGKCMQAFMAVILSMLVLATAYVFVTGIAPWVMDLEMTVFSFFSLVTFFEFATGIFEEVLFRGLAMTAALIKWGHTAKGRLLCVIIPGVVFGLVHIVSAGNSWLMTVLLTSVLGISFGAAYVYSKNLLGCMLIHMVWNLNIKLTGNWLVVDMPLTMVTIRNISNIIFIVLILVFAVIITVKAKPFELSHQVKPSK